MPLHTIQICHCWENTHTYTLYKESPAFGIWQDVHILAEGKTGSPCHMSYTIFKLSLDLIICPQPVHIGIACLGRVNRQLQPLPTPHYCHYHPSLAPFSSPLFSGRWLLGARSLPPELLGKVATLIIYPRNLFHLGNNSIDISRNI